MIRAALALTLVLAAPASGQVEVSTAQGAILRVLNKSTGDLVDLEMTSGESRQVARLTINLSECRFPAGNPTGDAFARLTVLEQDRLDAVFEGWMVASSPALNPMEHPRYDVWVLRCINS